MNVYERFFWLWILVNTWPWDNWTVVGVAITIGTYGGIMEAKSEGII